MSGNADLATPAFALIQNTWFEGFGTDAYGAEAIEAELRRHAPFAEATRHLRSARAQALIGTDAQGRPVGFFADIHDGWITRLWRLGKGAERVAPPLATSVPADADMDQRGGRLGFAPEAHPELDPAHAMALEALGQGWLADQPGEVAGRLIRARPLVLRAFSDGSSCAALIRLQGRFAHGLGGFFAIAMIDEGATIVVVDQDGRAAAERQPWTPALR